MARTGNRRTAAKRNPRRLDPAGGQERGGTSLWDMPEFRELVRRRSYEMMIAREQMREIYIIDATQRELDTRIALRRKLNGDTR